MSPLRRNDYFFLIVVSLLVTFVGLGRRELWNPVEPRYAGITAQLLRDGHWLLPFYNLEVYDQKPPLFFWLCAACLAKAPDDLRLFAVRLPSAIGACILTWLALSIGRRLFSERVGFLGALFTASSWLVFWSSRFCHMDTLMAAATLATTWWMKCAIDAGPGSRRRWIAAAATAAAVGILLKGIIVLAFPAAILLASTPWNRNGFRDAFWRSGLPIVTIAALAAFAAWFFPARASADGQWVKEMVLREGVTRLINRDEPDKHALHYYFGAVWAMAAPWCAFWPLYLLTLGRRNASSRPDGERFVRATFSVIFVLLFLSATFGSSSRSRYLMPLLPAGAILSAAAIDRFLSTAAGARRRSEKIAFSIAVGAIVAALLLGGLGTILAPFLLGTIDADLGAEAQRQMIAAILIGGALVAVAASAVFSWRKGAGECLVRRLVFGMALACGGWGTVGVAVVEGERRDDLLIAELKQAIAPDRKVVVHHAYADRESTPGFFSFYIDKNIHEFRIDSAALTELYAGPPVVLVVREKTVAREPLPKIWDSDRRGPFGFHRLYIYRNPAENGRRDR